MKYEYQQTPFSRAIFTGLFSGITAALACLLYDYIYRINTGYTLSEIVNVSSIIFASVILLTVAGLLYYWFSISFKGGNIVFVALFAGLTIFSLWEATGAIRSNSSLINVQFRHLLYGIIIILGFCSFILTPYLAQSKSFKENVV